MESQLQIYSGISIFGYVLAAVFLVASVAIFFLMDIRGVYAYLSGKKQQKGIMEMREKQQEEENKGKPIPDSARLGFTPPQKPESKKVSKKRHAEPNNKEVAAAEIQKPVHSGSETVNLQNADISFDNDATGILENPAVQNTAEDYPTDVLNAANTKIGSFTLIKNVMEIHTTEVL